MLKAFVSYKRARSGAIAELELRLNEIEEDRKRLYEAPELRFASKLMIIITLLRIE